MPRRMLVALALAAACGPSAVVDGPHAGDRADAGVVTAVDAAPPDEDRLELAVDGDTEWTAAGIEVARGELVRVTATGTISFDGETEVGPEGFGPDDHDRWNALGCADHAALLARVAAGGGAFAVGGSQRFLAPRAGALSFGPNDTRTVDNSGAFTLVIEPDQPVEIVAQESVTVAGDAGWIDTGIDVHPDHVIAIDADGAVDNNVPGGEADPDGLPGSADDPFNVLACANHMALIGRVGVSGAPFAVGRDLSRPAPASGRLFLRVNHSSPAENTGKFSAGILIGR